MHNATSASATATVPTTRASVTRDTTTPMTQTPTATDAKSMTIPVAWIPTAVTRLPTATVTSTTHVSASLATSPQTIYIVATKRTSVTYVTLRQIV